MKCQSCYTLNAPGDPRCIRCGLPLDRPDAELTFWDRLTSAETPGWAFALALACCMIPVVSLGGCGPIAIGLGGASLCITLSRIRWLPFLIRLPLCLAITGAAWLLFAVMMSALFQSSRR